ncbi:Cobalamin biosynthesis protein CobD [Frigidibacter albus]
MALDIALGWPDRLFRRIGHPVTWLGHVVSALDRRMNRAHRSFRARKLAGLAALLMILALVCLPALLVQCSLPGGLPGALLTGLLAWPLLATRSLHDHVAAVARPLMAGDIADGRRAVSMIVGRNPNHLDGPAIARAATESLAENTSDGIVAPLFWGVLFGLPGIAAYKAINTLDSMIGHRTPRHEAFGWASARLDDGVNLLPARLTGLLFALVSGRPVAALRCMWRDAGRHRSPNAGWPEAAMAGALGIRLSGPRIYDDRVSDEPWLNGEAPDPAPADLRRALGLYRRAMGALLLGLTAAAAVWQG